MKCYMAPTFLPLLYGCAWHLRMEMHFWSPCTNKTAYVSHRCLSLPRTRTENVASANRDSNNDRLGLWKLFQGPKSGRYLLFLANVKC